MKTLKQTYERVDNMLECELLTNWERSFLKSLKDLFGKDKETSLSARQMSKLQEIEEEYGYSPFVGERFFDPRAKD